VKERDILASIEAFSRDKPHFEVLSDDIAFMLSNGQAASLPEAYEKALQRAQQLAQRFIPQAPATEQPAAPPKPEPTKVDAAQTRAKAALSITGSPAGGSDPTTRKPAGSARESVQRALALTGIL
jgi:hypothetical protein